MKIIVTFILSCCFFSLSYAQNYASLKPRIAAFTGQVKEVEAGDTKRSQAASSAGNGQALTFNVSVTDKKGNTTAESYYFNLADLDGRALAYKIQKNIITLKAGVKNNKKYIKKTTNDSKSEFVNSFDIHALNIDNARALVDALKKCVEEAEKIEAQVKPKENYAELISWLSQIIGSDVMNGDRYEQQFSVAKDFLTATLKQAKTDKKGAKIEKTYLFNLGDIGAVESEVKTDDAYLDISAKNKNKYIREVESGDKITNVNSLTLVCTDLDRLRAIEKAFSTLASLAEKQLEKTRPAIRSLNDAFSIISEGIQPLKTGKSTIDQKAKMGCASSVTVTTTTEKATTLDVYSFNMADLNDKKTEISSKNTSLKLDISAVDKFITYTQNDIRQNYTNSFEILTDDIDKIRYLPYAISYAVEKCREAQKTITPKGGFTEVMREINQQTPNFKSEKEDLKQNFEIQEASGCAVKFNQNFSGGKSATDMTYEFGFKEINKESVQLSVSGKNVFATFQTNNKEKVIKTYENGKPGNYTNSVKIQVDDLDRARNLLILLKQAITLCNK